MNRDFARLMGLFNNMFYPDNLFYSISAKGAKKDKDSKRSSSDGKEEEKKRSRIHIFHSKDEDKHNKKNKQKDETYAIYQVLHLHWLNDVLMQIL